MIKNNRNRKEQGTRGRKERKKGKRQKGKSDREAVTTIIVRMARRAGIRVMCN